MKISNSIYPAASGDLGIGLTNQADCNIMPFNKEQMKICMQLL